MRTLENPQIVNWSRLGGKRGVFTASDAPSIQIEPEYENVKVSKAGSITGGPRIVLDPPFTYENSKGEEEVVKGCGLFTWTTKMSCPSYSLPAGPMESGGTCPAAKASAIEREGSYSEFHSPFSEKPRGETVICDTCYAGKGRYGMYASIAIRQVVKYHWTLRTLKAGSFVGHMSQAIGALASDRDLEKLLKSRAVSNIFFRIHDSGDFFSPEYYRAWVEVCRNLPKVKFWAPTRMWVYDKWRLVFENYPPPNNLSLRPSALFTSAEPPDIEGMAAGTTSVAGEFGGDVKDCPAYAGDHEHSCAAARCRTCWVEQDVPVNYLTH